MKYPTPSFVPNAILDIAEKRNITAVTHPSNKMMGYIVLPGDKRMYFARTTLDVNPFGAATIAKNKSYTRFFLEQEGYSIPKGATCSTAWTEADGTVRDARWGAEYAEKIGFPVIVKPNASSWGRGVYKCQTKADVEKHLISLHNEGHECLVEECVSGFDVRVVIYNGEYFAAYIRTPLSLKGDGVSTVTELIEKKKEALSHRDIDIDSQYNRIVFTLEREGYTPESVLEEGTTLTLLDSANAKTGGDLEDISDILAPRFRELAIQSSKALNLPLCGVDMIIDGDVSKDDSKESIIELNGSLGFNHYVTLGKEAEDRIYAMFEKIVDDFIQK
ncbi:MAG: D-alanine-D-alanine ligase-like ATP-grasp enzyme [Flavobacteriaceae bacterium]|jgi:D-alanine-D-alanine ligase-like ATP-grasp enzyme